MLMYSKLLFFACGFCEEETHAKHAKFPSNNSLPQMTDKPTTAIDYLPRRSRTLNPKLLTLIPEILTLHDR